MTDQTAAEPIEVPGSPAPPLDALLGIDQQAEVAARMRADLRAVDEAVRRAAVSRPRPLPQDGWD